MKTIMSVALGVAIGVFLYQYFTGTSRGKLNGRLHKSDGNRVISGVCAGFAEWLGADPTIVRIAWALLALSWGSGVLLYIICALVMPDGSAGQQRNG